MIAVFASLADTKQLINLRVQSHMPGQHIRSPEILLTNGAPVTFCRCRFFLYNTANALLPVPTSHVLGQSISQIERLRTILAFVGDVRFRPAATAERERGRWSGHRRCHRDRVHRLAPDCWTHRDSSERIDRGRTVQRVEEEGGRWQREPYPRSRQIR
jgi:hypothetical protein